MVLSKDGGDCVAEVISNTLAALQSDCEARDQDLMDRMRNVVDRLGRASAKQLYPSLPSVRYVQHYFGLEVLVADTTRAIEVQVPGIKVNIDQIPGETCFLGQETDPLAICGGYRMWPLARAASRFSLRLV